MSIRIVSLSIESSKQESELLVLSGFYTISVEARPAEKLRFYAEYDIIEDIISELDIFLIDSKENNLESISELIELSLEDVLLSTDMTVGDYHPNYRVANFFSAIDEQRKILKSGFDRNVIMFKRKVFKETNKDDLIVVLGDFNNFL